MHGVRLAPKRYPAVGIYAPIVIGVDVEANWLLH